MAEGLGFQPSLRRGLLCAGLALLSAAGGAEAADPNASIVINEVLASNSSILFDQQFQYDDWVELYNRTDTPIDVGGMYLTDDLADPTKWQIRGENRLATTIPAHDYLLIWTDGDVSAGGLHASFRLSADGEEIALVAADGATLIDTFSFGAQYVDVSYGRYPDGSDELRFMTVPTPAAANVSMYEGIVQEPQIDVTSRLCTEPITITLSTATEGATVYYTLNGSSPFSITRGRPLGTTYTEPIRIGGTATLKVAAWRPGWRESPERTERYVFVSHDLRTFSSPLPICVVDSLGKGISTRAIPAYGYFFDTDDEGRATVSGEINFGGRGGINVRGKSSGGFPKHQYHFETWDEDNDDLDVSILGLPPDSDWILQGPYSDKSLMRNVLAYQWSNEIGRYAPRTRFVEMFLNTGDAVVSMKDYIGVYVFMEKIKIGPDRVNITEVEPDADAEPEISGGYIVKKDKLDSDDVTFRTSRGQQLVYADPNGHNLTGPQRDWIRQYINAFEAALYGPNFTDPASGYAQSIDVDSFVDHHIIVELCKNIDGFRLSTYMFKDRNGKLNMGPVWDYNLSLGNADYLQGWIATGWYGELLGDGDYPYWRRLFQDPEFQLRYADRWFQLRRGLFANERLLGIVDDYAALLEEPQARNFERWNILGRYVWPNWFIASTFRQEIEWMKGWLADRLTWMDGEIGRAFAAAPPSFSQQGGHVDAGYRLAMNSPFGQIHYTVDGPDPRTLGAAATSSNVLISESAPKRVLVPIRPVDNAWRGSQPYDDSDWTLLAGSPGGVGYETSFGYEEFIGLDVRDQMYGKQASCCLRIGFAFDGDVGELDSLTLGVRYDDGFVAYLNGVEIGRRNFAGTPTWNSSADNMHDDFAAVDFENVEITNFREALREGDNILAIHGLNESIGSSDFLISVVLTAGESTQQGPPSESIVYVSPIPIAETVRVTARALEHNRWSALNEAVFAVGPVAESLRISELMYHADDPNIEYVELTNIGDETVNLNLVRFTDGLELTFPSVELTPRDHCLVVKDIAAFEAQYGAGFNIVGQYAGGLNNASERITLQDAAGQTIHDFEFRDDWFGITDGLGFSLTVKDPATTDPNGLGDKRAWRPSAFSGGSPGFDDTGAVPALGTVVINELLANSTGGIPDWIELHNTTDETMDIGGWFLSDDADNLTKYEIHEGTTISAGGYLVLYQDQHFGNTNDAGCHAPFALSRSGETVYLHSGSGGMLSGYSETEKFDASDRGVSLGRYQKTTGTYNFVSLSEPTPNHENAYPQVGPVVISEIMFHPDAVVDAEYVELLNAGDAAVTLYDLALDAPWRFTDDPDNPAIEFLFPTDPPVTLDPGQYLLLVKDLVSFTSRYTVPAGMEVFAWGPGSLANDGEKIQLSKPGNADGGARDWIRVDRVVYSDGSHHGRFPDAQDPWPSSPDGQGSSLERIDPEAYGNDPGNWQAATPSPGRQPGATLPTPPRGQ